MKEYSVMVNQKRIHVTEYEGVKGPIITVHGLTGNHHNMRYYAENLAGEYKVLSVDLRGRGNSDETNVNTSICNHSRDILDLIKKLSYKEVILVGHSMGAYISALVASESDLVKKVVLLDGTAKVGKRHDEIVKPSLGRLSKKYESKENYINEVKNIYCNLGIDWDEKLETTVEYEVFKNGEHWENKSNETRVLEDWNSFKSFNPKEVMSQIDCPVLLVIADGKIGNKEPLFLLDEYEETLNYTRDITVFNTNSNHYTMVFEKRPEINYAVQNFLKNE